MANRLAGETSPYLLQHADNPVDWYPWGPEALEVARQQEKPILLSIGYAACHWCHVMAHESFEDDETARLMNELFVNIKVDREERPDIDSIYMQAVQAMTGQGGWPMTMFLTPEGMPFYGGTYFPPSDRHGIPSFRRILTSVGAAWREQRGKVHETVDALRKLYADAAVVSSGRTLPNAQTLELAFRALSRRFDFSNAGFDSAPKFPPTMVLEFLLAYWRRTGNEDALRMVTDTFVRMARGGIYDQLGGGFARYSVDARWLVPHFEKMLYDNALLVRLGANLYKATRDEEVKRVTMQTVEWARREMLSPEGGFYSSYDADSEGEEGRFYIWSAEEIDRIAGEDAKVIREYYGVSADGNFEGHNILNRRASDAVAATRSGITVEELETAVARAGGKLLAARSARVWPGRDDKIIASWNGLMVRALFTAAEAFDESDYANVALRSAEFLFDALTKETGGDLRALRSFNRGEARIPGFLEDHAALALAAIAAYERTFDSKWLKRAAALATSCAKHFLQDGILYDTASDGEQLVTRPRDISDNAIPSGHSLAAELFLLIGDFLGDDNLTTHAENIISTVSDSVTRFPTAFGHMLCATDTFVHGATQVAIIEPSRGDQENFAALRRAVDSHYIPARMLAGTRQGSAELPGIPLLSEKAAINNRTTAYLCRRYLCDTPTSDPDQLSAQIDAAVTSTGRMHPTPAA